MSPTSAFYFHDLHDDLHCVLKCVPASPKVELHAYIEGFEFVMILKSPSLLHLMSKKVAQLYFHTMCPLYIPRYTLCGGCHFAAPLFPREMHELGEVYILSLIPSSGQA